MLPGVVAGYFPIRVRRPDGKISANVIGGMQAVFGLAMNFRKTCLDKKTPDGANAVWGFLILV